jgi:hypothetical protein
MNWAGARDGQGEHGVDHGGLDHRAEGLTVVDVGSLGEAVKGPASLVPFQRAVEVIIKDNQIIFIARYTNNKRSP